MAQNKFEIVRLGNPMAIASTSQILKDKELRQEVRSDVGKVLKAVGITAAGITVFVVAKKIVRRIKANKAVRDAKKAVNEKDLSYEAAWYSSSADSLKKAMDGNSWYSNYDETAIKRVLSNLKSSSDWWQLYKDYGVDKYDRNLTTALQSDGDMDVAEYASILKKIGVTL